MKLLFRVEWEAI